MSSYTPNDSSKGWVYNITHFISKFNSAEGPRGHANRYGLLFRYISFFFLILLLSSITQFSTEGVTHASGGGIFMFLSVSAVYFIGAFSSLFYVNLRKEIVERVRHYVFGIILLPGTLIALFMKVTVTYLGNDTLGSTLGSALPVVFLATVILPVFIFIKEMAGIRTLYRTKLDDQEQVSLWTRNDGYQR